MRLAAIIFQEAMYDMGEFAAVSKPAIELLQPAPFSVIAFSLAEAREVRDHKPMRGPGG